MRGETRRSGRQTGNESWGKNRNTKTEQLQFEKIKVKVKAREKQKRGKTHASCPAVRGERSSWQGADTGLLGVFIDVHGFNPQYWPKPLAEGC